VIRRTPRPQTNWTVIRNEVIADPKLSFKATGVLIYILSKPDHWNTSTVQLAKVKKEGLDAIRTALTELRHAGYVRTRRYQDERGRWQYETEVFDTPQPVQNRVDNEATCPPPRRDNPREDNAPVLVKTQQVKTMRSLASSKTAKPRLCGHCHGIGKTLSPNDDILTCTTCNGAGIG